MLMRVRGTRRAGAGPARLAVAAMTAVALATGTSACGSGCQGTTLAAHPVTANSPGAPLALSARLTSGGKPLPGFVLNFYSKVTGGAESGSGHDIGSATTGANGTARVSRPDTLSQALLPGERLTGYQVRFDSTLQSDRGNYCSTKLSVPVTSHWTAPS